MRRLGGVFGILALLWATSASAGGRGEYSCHKPVVGDEDPFPLRCTSFSGIWRADSGETSYIQQRGCDWLRVEMFWGSEKGVQTIVPDNCLRSEGPGGQVRHRWNDHQYGSVLESHRLFADARCRTKEVSLLESASDNIMLLTIYRDVECPASSGKVRHEYEQHIFRRVSSAL